ncbi:MAG: hypothetical protein ABI723_19930 [Bacteroidia bacterium]
MQKRHQNIFQFLLLFVLILISRLPFLSAGYGVEEDSWGMMNALRRIHETGLFEVSRFPGHPVLEFCYLALWGKSYFVFNFLTAFISSIGLLFFAAVIKQLGFRKYFWSTLALAFIPVVYIKCTDTMDFMWGFSFMMVCLYFVLRSRASKNIDKARFHFFLAGIALGLAIGTRFTSAVFILPLLILFFDLTKRETWYQFIVLSGTTLSVTLLCFFQTIKNYDADVYFAPYILGRPEFLKSVFKASVGVFGIIGCVVLATIIVKTFIDKKRLRNRFNKKYFIKAYPKLQISKFISFTYCAFIIYVLIFTWQPHKSAYLIAALPFLIMLIEFYSNEKYSVVLAIGMIASSFFLGINLEDDFHGASSSPISLKLKMASQTLSIDLLKGPILADYSKRKQKMNFVENVIAKAKAFQKPTVIIAGWFINEIEVLGEKDKNPQVNYFYFLTEEDLKKYQQQNIPIFYLPQQDQVNDMRWKKNFTRSYAKPLYNDSGQIFLF